MQSIHFEKNQLNRLFPFYITIQSNLYIESVGPTLEKIFPGTSDGTFTQHFKIERPAQSIIDFEVLKSLTKQLVVITCHNLNKTSLRGQFEYIEETNQLIFLGSPWFDSIETVIKNNLTIHDFAIHDPVIDLLNVLKTQEITTEDLKHFLVTNNKQKKELQAANLEIKNIALFPTQNPDPLIRINFEGELLRMNPAAEKLHQFQFNDEYYTPEKLYKYIATHIDKTKDRWTIEVKSEDKDYSFVCISMMELGYINLYGRDITQLLKDQQELQQLSLIIQQTHTGIIITDSYGKVEWVNNAFTTITGYTLDEMMGITPGSILQGKDTDPIVAKYMSTQIKESKPFTCEIYNYKKSGEGYWLRINGQPIFDKSGKVSKFFAIEEDITKEKNAQVELNKAANRMSTLITSLHAGVLLENEDRTISLINQQFCNLFHIPLDPAELIGSDCSQSAQQTKVLFAHPEKFVSDVDQILLDRKLMTGEKLELADGRFYERDFIPLWNEGKYNGHLWIYKDISKRIQAENELKIAKKATEDLAQTKHNFLTNMSHEIRTPMNAILGMTEQLSKTTLNNNQHLYLNTIQNASEHLMVIINDILDLSKIEAGKLSIENIGFEPKVLVGKVMQTMNYKAEEKGLTLTNSKCDSRLSDVFLGDPFRLNQILLNLVSNAIKFTENGSVDISCDVTNETNTHQTVHVKVTDTGVGMDELFVSKLFNKFTQEDDTVSRKFGGTGLGLSICKNLIELMGGHIFIESKKNIGTTASFEITFEKTTPDQIYQKENIEVNTSIFKHKKVLVVDDNNMNRLLATTILNNYGIEIIEASNGEEAILAFKKNKIDLILMDIQMPLLNGIEATKIIRKELRSTVPIIALTANAMLGENEKCINAGMNDYLSKPFDEDQLLGKLSINFKQSTIPNQNIKITFNSKPSTYDLSTLQKMSNGNNTFVNSMIALFIEEVPIFINDINVSFNNNDLLQLKKTIHKILPSVSNFGITHLENELKSLNEEPLLLNNSLKEKIAYIEDELLHVVDKLKTELV